jgi:hypothetical protein
MRALVLGTLVVSLLAGGMAGAQTANDPLMGPIKTFIETFNKGDVAGAAATHVKTAALTIVDEVPPYLWHGPDAVTAWSTDLDAYAKKQGITGQIVAISAPTRKETIGDVAYVIVPAVYSFTQGGAAMSQSAQMTFTLTKGPSGWLIQSWTWTGPGSRPAGKPKS